MLDFFMRGGPILGVILAITLLMWFLIIERYWYSFFQKNNSLTEITADWVNVSTTCLWELQMIRRYYISQFRQKMTQHIAWIKILVTVSILLGLLGTITGMIGVFEGMLLTQASDVRVLAEGVSRTVIPAMAGLVAALSGFYFSFQLEQSALRDVQKLADKLVV